VTKKRVKNEETFAQFQPGKDIFSRIIETELGQASLVQPGSTPSMQESDVRDVAQAYANLTA